MNAALTSMDLLINIIWYITQVNKVKKFSAAKNLRADSDSTFYADFKYTSHFIVSHHIFP